MDRQNSGSQQNSKQNSHKSNGISNHAPNGESTNHDYQTPGIDTESPEYYQVFLERLLGLVSNGRPEIVEELITLIRSGASQQEIFAALSEFTADGGPSDPGNKTQAP